MDYINDLHRIEQDLSILDNTSYDTIEEANHCLIKYDKLKDDIILIIKRVLNDFSCSFSTKERIYNQAIQVLTNHLGSADDIQKYGNILECFQNDGMITKEQLNHFYDNLDIGRWR
ncbi:Uncharacterised protein [Porphyromonas macacae]|uniref:Uncharacterized protein n=1 Tax=Porphyromonas macacae TaxID=28115 RepID=A0A379E704_9PORP|nr:hypothetical protein [Porphyromonas macacae]SUB88446.1 Uncharacterised protein [Porphyromonas macacae]